jgi:hypothetical protein
MREVQENFLSSIAGTVSARHLVQQDAVQAAGAQIPIGKHCGGPWHDRGLAVLAEHWRFICFCH